MNYADDYVEDDILLSFADAHRYERVLDLRHAIESKLDESALFLIKIALNPNKKVLK